MARYQKVETSEVFAVLIEQAGDLQVNGKEICALEEGSYLVIQDGIAAFLTAAEFEAQGYRKARGGGGGGSQAPRGETRAKVLEAVQGGETSASEIAKALGTTYGNVRSHLKRLWNDGLVVKGEDGSWTPAEPAASEV